MEGKAPSSPLKNNQAQSKRGPGGARPGAGRKAGVPNKATASIRDIAREYTTEAVKALVEVLKDNQQPAAARVSAASAILDRGFGKPSSVLAGDEDGGAVKMVHEIILRGVAAQ